MLPDFSVLLCGSRLNGLAFDGHTLQFAPRIAVVEHRVMLSRAIVPKGDRSLFPFEAHLILGTGDLVEQVRKQTFAFLLGQTNDMRRKRGIDEQNFRTSIRMNSNYWMYDRRIVASISAILSAAR